MLTLQQAKVELLRIATTFHGDSESKLPHAMLYIDRGAKDEVVMMALDIDSSEFAITIALKAHEVDAYCAFLFYEAWTSEYQRDEDTTVRPAQRANRRSSVVMGIDHPEKRVMGFCEVSDTVPRMGPVQWSDEMPDLRGLDGRHTKLIGRTEQDKADILLASMGLKVKVKKTG